MQNLLTTMIFPKLDTLLLSSSQLRLLGKTHPITDILMAKRNTNLHQCQRPINKRNIAPSSNLIAVKQPLFTITRQTLSKLRWRHYYLKKLPSIPTPIKIPTRLLPSFQETLHNINFVMTPLQGSWYQLPPIRNTGRY